MEAPCPDSSRPWAPTSPIELPAGDDWIFEVKWDGVRGLAYIDDGALAIYTRNDNRCEQQYPELQVLPHYIDAEQAILDGEIAVLDAQGRLEVSN